MSLGQWINSLTFFDHLVLLVLFLIGLYFSKATLEALIHLYKKKQGDNPYQVKYRVTPAALLSVAIVYTIILYHLMSGVIGSFTG